MQNPFTLTFGVIPEKFIDRQDVIASINEGFISGNNKSNTYIITGLRGSGKTVMLNYLRKYFDSLDDWIVINVNPEMDILESIASKLYEKATLKKYFVKPTFNFSFKGFGFSLEGDSPIKNIETLLEKMMAIIKSKDKKVLVTIDEISNNENVKVFTHTFKNLVNDNYPLYLLATGLYENIYSLQNEKTLTFIYRAPKIDMKPLSATAIAKSYMDSFDLSEEEAFKFAALTEGYASAYQILGTILFNSKKKTIDEDLIFEFDKYLEDVNYNKLWDDLSKNDREFLYGFTSPKDNKASSIIANSKIKQESYSKYRERLIKKGVVKADSYGYLSLCLPRLYDYIRRRKLLDSF